MIINLTPNSPQWLEWRNKGLGSSDAPVILGHCPWRDLQDLYREKTFHPEVKQYTNQAMQRGTLLEPIARNLYIEKTGRHYEPMIFEHDKHSWIRASLDGYNPDLNKGIEIKCPVRFSLYKAENIPANYMAQIQWQIMCCNLTSVDYVVYDGDQYINIVNVKPNKPMQRQLYWYGKYFWTHVLMNKKPRYKVSFRDRI